MQWLVRAGEFHSKHGYCSCPVLFEDKVIVNGMRKIFFPGQPVKPRDVPMDQPNLPPPAPQEAPAQAAAEG